MTATEDFEAENSQSYKIQCGKVRRCRALAPKNPPWKITSYTDRRRFFRRTTFLDSAVISQKNLATNDDIQGLFASKCIQNSRRISEQIFKKLAAIVLYFE